MSRSLAMVIGIWLLTFSGLASAGPTEKLLKPGNTGADLENSPGELEKSKPVTTLGLVELLDKAVEKLAKQKKQEAFGFLKRSDYPAALRGFQEAMGLDALDPDITVNLAYLYQRLGNYRQAERYFRKTIELDPLSKSAYLDLADLLCREQASQQQLSEASDILIKAREIAGNKPDVILRQARVAAQRGRFDEAEQFYRSYLNLHTLDDAIRLELGDFYRDFDRSEQALFYYRNIHPTGAIGRDASQRVFELEVDQQARHFGFSQRGQAVRARARGLASKGRFLFGQGQYQEAEGLLREAIRLSPQFALARINLGDLLRATDRSEEAELSYLRALAMDGRNAEIQVRLADLYLDENTSQRNDEAVLFLERALTQRPDWTELRLKLAVALQKLGDLPSALLHVNRYLAETPQDADRIRAVNLKNALVQLLQPNSVPSLDSDTSSAVLPNPGLDESLIQPLSRARTHLKHGATDAALAELRGLTEQQRSSEVLDLEARILYAAGRMEDAKEVWMKSLKQSAEQPMVHAQLGMILARQRKDDQARYHLKKAEVLGEPSAIYHLARLDAGAASDIATYLLDIFKVFELVQINNRLDNFLNDRGFTSYRKQAESLQQEIRMRIIRVTATVGFCLVVFSIGLLIVRRRFWGGIDLAELLSRYPETGPEVQRILSAIRHEVLKHNTMVLEGLSQTIGRGGDISHKAVHCQRSLFGVDGEQGANQRLHHYVDQLQQIGRAHAVHLNLKRKDQTISSLLRGFRQLSNISGLLSTADSLTGLKRNRLLRGLKIATQLLNTDGYQGVCKLLDQIRILQVDRETLIEIFQRTCREPAFADSIVARLVFDSESHLPCSILIPQQAFEDILANLIRNALQSSLHRRISNEPDLSPTTSNSETVVIGLGVETRQDYITGLERMVFLIRDRSQEQLTDEMLRGRYIEEGLGLTADLVSRYDGSLKVVNDHPDWTKAVAVELPKAYPE